jgi:hypothetical protein
LIREQEEAIGDNQQSGVARRLVLLIPRMRHRSVGRVVAVIADPERGEAKSR